MGRLRHTDAHRVIYFAGWGYNSTSYGRRREADLFLAIKSDNRELIDLVLCERQRVFGVRGPIRVCVAASLRENKAVSPQKGHSDKTWFYLRANDRTPAAVSHVYGRVVVVRLRVHTSRSGQVVVAQRPRGGTHNGSSRRAAPYRVVRQLLQHDDA